MKDRESGPHQGRYRAGCLLIVLVLLSLALAFAGCSFAGGGMDYKGSGNAVLTITEGRVEGASAIEEGGGMEGPTEAEFTAEARVAGVPGEQGEFKASAWHFTASKLLILPLIVGLMF